MKRGFTLLELIIVIIIIGILATLGFAQYARMVEHARGAEARLVIGKIRNAVISYYVQYGGFAGFPGSTEEIWGIGTYADQIPILDNCRPDHYFTYTVNVIILPSSYSIIARRCTAGGKNPQGSAALELQLIENLANGAIQWTGTGGY